ncbi:hypothetical protein FA13DRAFT_1787319 [Coprinellus micaceus]|uniref:C2H2-type domain-containing protein n=1 Tax=Coprinellus micaceus TaxID=71717 RepID=A0A4Y7TT51_COPMI|nr:hypothetical protein FA13DRAFT_1787319 [Coprinellus micaceus]
MSFPCNQCNLTFASPREINKHIKGDHVNMWTGTSDEEMESDPGSPEHKTSRKRLREDPEEDEGPSTRRLRKSRNVSPTNVTMEEVFDDNASPSSLSAHAPSPPVSEEYTRGDNFTVTSSWLASYGLAINSRLQLFNCLECRQMYHAKNVAAHLGTHSRVIKKVFKTKLADVVSVQRIHSDYPTIPPTTVMLELAGLDMVKEFGCPVCPQAGSKATVEQHIRAKHPRQGHKAQADVYTQVLNKGAARTRLRVTPIGQVGDKDTDTPAGEWKGKFKSLYKNVLDTTRVTPNARYISPWLMRTGWHTLIDNRDPAPLVELVSMPKKDDPLYWVDSLVREYMEDASSLIQGTSIHTLQRLNSAEPDNELNHTPFHLHHQHKDTMRRYALPAIHLVCALLRPALDDFAFSMTTALWGALETLREERSSSALHQVFKELWLHEWPSGAGESFPDPTICFLGLLTLRPTGQFGHAKDATAPIAMLTRSIQLTVLKELHLRKDESPDLHEMKEMMKLQVWVKSHEMTTFSDLTSLQKYATTISLSTLGFPKVIFPNRHQQDYNQMIYDGQPVSVQNLQDIYTRVQDKAIELWEQDVLMGLKLHVIYNMIHDNLSSDEPGYCFLDNPNNVFKTYTDALFNAVMDDPALFKDFMMKGPTGEWVINPHRAMKWFQKLEELELHMLLGTEMKSGAPGRMSELTCSLVRNRNTRIRNVMGVGRYLALIGQYSKNTNNQQMDKMIPRAFSGFEQDMIIQIHAIARPFAMVLAKLLWPEEPEVSMNYGELLFMGFKKQFDPDLASKLMGKHSSAVLGWPMTVRPHRHIHIAFKGHKCKGLIDAELEKEITSGIHALQSGHSVATERRVYGLDKDSLAGISEDMVTLYLDASRDFQRAFQIPPAGQCLPYDQVKMSDFVTEEVAMPPRVAAGQATDLTPILSMLVKMQESFNDGQKALLEKVTSLEREVSQLKEQRASTGLNPSGDYEMQSIQDSHDDALPFAQDCSDSDDDMYVLDDPVEPEQGSTTELVMGASGTHNRFLDHTQSGDSMLQHLRHLLGQPDATWRSVEQRSAVDALLKLEQDVIVALPTGIGKSVIAVLPSQVENAVTVIIIPLTALMEDWKRRLTALNVQWEHFEGSKNPRLIGHANIVLVSSDVARNIHWRKAFAELSAQRPIARVVRVRVRVRVRG